MKRLVPTTLALGCLALHAAFAIADSGQPAKTKDRSVEDVLRVVARRQVRDLADGEYRRGSRAESLASRPPQGIVWNYSWGVTQLGLQRAAQVLPDKALLDFVVKHNEIAARHYEYLRWQERARGINQRQTLLAALKRGDLTTLRKEPLHELLLFDRLDFCGAMGAAMLESFLRHGAKATREEEALLKDIADYVTKRQPRMEDGTFWRPVVETPFDNKLDQSLWIDDLYMGCPFLVRWAEYARDPEALDDAARQVVQMARRQQDEDGVWFHGNLIAEKKIPPFKWGRGNGWAMVATVEVLSALPETHPAHAELLSILRRHIAGVEHLQAPSGLWHQLLDQTDIWEETSCSAMFAYSIARAVRRGWIPPENLGVAQRAFAGVARNVADDGQVNGTCEGTEIGRDAAYYASRQRPPNDIHGIGIVLLAGAELLQAAKR
jgi:unsaturated rhamnogalacturonyl hydrolase